MRGELMGEDYDEEALGAQTGSASAEEELSPGPADAACRSRRCGGTSARHPIWILLGQLYQPTTCMKPKHCYQRYRLQLRPLCVNHRIDQLGHRHS